MTEDQKWQRIGQLWASSHRACDDCPCNVTIRQRHPYQEGYAVETLSHCVLTNPDECPALESETAAQAAELED